MKRGTKGEKSQVRAYVMHSINARPHGKVASDMMEPGSKAYTDTASLLLKDRSRASSARW